jgi:phospholipid/cholesterol/gamma-HCH transport system permease protein
MASEERIERLKAPVEAIGQAAIDSVEDLGKLGILSARALLMSIRPPFRLRQLLVVMEDVGVGSLFIVLLTGVFSGGVFALQSVQGFRQFGAESLVGTTVALTLSRELGPVFTGLMVAGRSGSAMATTLGTMRVTEQIDAMEVMAVDPVQYLVTPRLIGTIIMMPLLTMLFVFIGMVGAFGVSVGLLGVDPGIFVNNIAIIVNPVDLIYGAIKAAVFGLAIASVGCFKGFYASGGAKGVGEATTSAVVLSSVLILILNYFMTSVMFT